MDAVSPLELSVRRVCGDIGTALSGTSGARVTAQLGALSEPLIGLSVCATRADLERWVVDGQTRAFFDDFVIVTWLNDVPANINGRVIRVPELYATVEACLAAHQEVIPHGWVFRVDPDEWITRELTDAVRDAVAGAFADHVFALPYQYFVGARALRGGVWGGVRAIPRVHHSSRRLLNHVHASLGDTSVPVDGPPVEHRWVKDPAELRQKHVRYLALEGAARLSLYGHFTWRRSVVELGRTGASVLLRKRPWRDEWLGVQLAGEFLRYQTAALLAWRRASLATQE